MANMSYMLQKARKEIAIVDPGAAQQGWLFSSESYLTGNPVGSSLPLSPIIFSCPRTSDEEYLLLVFVYIF